MNGLGRNTNNEKKREPLFTKETFGVVFVLFASLSLVCLITRNLVFGNIGVAVSDFLLGIFGYFAYAVEIALEILGFTLITGKEIDISPKYKFLITAMCVLLAVFLHVLSVEGEYSTLGDYVKLSYNMGTELESKFSAGGFFTGLIAYAIIAVLSKVGALVVTGSLFAFLTYVLIGNCIKFNFKRERKSVKPIGSFVNNQETESAVQTQNEQVQFNSVNTSSEVNATANNYSTIAENKPQNACRLFVNKGTPFAFKSKREMAHTDENSVIRIKLNENGFGVGSVNGAYTQDYSEDLKNKINYIKTPATINFDDKFGGLNNNVGVSNVIKPTEPVRENFDEVKPIEKPILSRNTIPAFEHDTTESKTIESVQAITPKTEDAKSHADSFADKYASAVEDENKERIEPNEVFRPLDVKPIEKPIESPSKNTTEVRDLFHYLDIDAKKEETQNQESEDLIEEKPIVSKITDDKRTRSIFFNEDSEVKKEEPTATKSFDDKYSQPVKRDSIFDMPSKTFERSEKAGTPKAEEKEVKAEKPKPPINRKYYRPPIDLLESYIAPVDAPKEDHETRIALITKMLEDFRITVEPQGYIQGPSITRYEFKMPAGVSVKNILRLDDDLKMCLSSQDDIRIEAPIPGKNLIGIEVPNKYKVTVGLKEIIKDSGSKPVKPGSLTFAIGKDIVGKAITDDLSKGPHFLVAGATGSGKSVCLNAMIVSLIMRYSPEELRLILIDPKGNEFINYEHIPHLMIDEIITEPKKALVALAWARDEMERRYKVLAECGGIKDIDSYNENIASDTVPKMAKIVVIVDELSNLMETCKRDMESLILSIAQKARAVGIHLVLATQRPSVDVITGTIKANLPSRIALKVTNFADSNTILAIGGAEKLLGHGDMLYKNSGMGECERYQGVWISDREINAIVGYVKEKNVAYFDDSMQEYIDKETKPKQEETSSSSGGDDENSEYNEFFLNALWFAICNGSISISLFQRHFQIGYARAGGLVDKMERLGFISGNEGVKARKVLITREEYIERFGPPSEA